MRLQIFKDDADILWKEYKEKCDIDVGDAKADTEKMRLMKE